MSDLADLIDYKIAFHIGNNYMAFLQFEFLCGSGNHRYATGPTVRLIYANII